MSSTSLPVFFSSLLPVTLSVCGPTLSKHVHSILTCVLPIYPSIILPERGKEKNLRLDCLAGSTLFVGSSALPFQKRSLPTCLDLGCMHGF